MNSFWTKIFLFLWPCLHCKDSTTSFSELFLHFGTFLNIIFYLSLTHNFLKIHIAVLRYIQIVTIKENRCESTLSTSFLQYKLGHLLHWQKHISKEMRRTKFTSSPGWLAQYLLQNWPLITTFELLTPQIYKWMSEWVNSIPLITWVGTVILSN